MRLRTAIAALLLCASVASAGWLQWWDAAGAARTGATPIDHTDGGSLKLWWRMDATDTGAYIVDASGNGNSAYQHWGLNQPSITNGYAYLDGTDHATNRVSTLFNGATNILISAWVKPSPKVNYAGIMLMRGSGTASGLHAYATTNAQWRVMNGGSQSAANSTPVDTWTHLAGHWTTNGMYSFWINGVIVAYSTNVSNGVPLTVNNKWYLGYDSGYSDRGWKGYLDDIRIYIGNPSGSNFISQIYAAGRQ